MNSEQIYEVVEKLNGEVKPYGATHIDGARYENMKTFIEVFRKMHILIDNVATDYKDHHEHSIKEIVKLANNQLDDMGIDNGESEAELLRVVQSFLEINESTASFDIKTDMMVVAIESAKRVVEKVTK